MNHAIPPEVQAHIAEGVAWVWDKFGQKIVEKVVDRGVDEAKWQLGISKYYLSLFERVGFVRVLGRMESEPLENVFTHVNVLDKLSAERRYDVNRLITEFGPRDFSWTERVKRVPGDEAIAEFNKIFILGKPGAGKTTFLKHTALRAINREIDGVPVFVTLKELSDSGMEIVPFIVHQFKIHRLPEPEIFVERLLKSGKALVLFDGLDEVNLEGNKRADLIRALNDFVYQYSDCMILITCRVAATDYSFTQFEYVEMADFDEIQMGCYIDLWFVGDGVKRKACRSALLENEENKAVRELAQTPLLLALLCLVYEERGEFPPNRDEIYDEATRALLVKWDSSRNILRDGVYKQLSLKHKQKMLAHIAAHTFDAGDYFLPEEKVVGLIETYLKGVPGLEEPDGELVLKAMEAQHGIFVERARRIHSFSHLTLQEYFAARYIVDNEQRDTIEQLMHHVGDDRWREVFRLTAGMLDDATVFFEQYLLAVAVMIQGVPQLLGLLQWAVQKSERLQVAYKPSAVRAFLIYHARDLVRTSANVSTAHDTAHDTVFGYAHPRDLVRALSLVRTLDFDLAFSHDHARDLVRARANVITSDHARANTRAFDLDSAHQAAEQFNLSGFKVALEAITMPAKSDGWESWQQFARTFADVLDEYQDEWDPRRKMAVTEEDAQLFADISGAQVDIFVAYLEANRLLVRCVQVAYVPDREAIENQILLPPHVELPGS